MFSVVRNSCDFVQNVVAWFSIYAIDSCNFERDIGSEILSRRRRIEKNGTPTLRGTFHRILSSSIWSDWFHSDMEYIINIECHHGISISNVSPFDCGGKSSSLRPFHIFNYIYLLYYLLCADNNSNRRRTSYEKDPAIFSRTKHDERFK